MIKVLSFYFVLLFLPSTVVAIVQNVTINSAALGIKYLPQGAWSVSTDSHATGGSFVQSSAENATVVFNLTSELNLVFLIRPLGLTEQFLFLALSTMVFWHGFKPRTAARYSICIDCSDPEALGSVLTIESGSQSDEPVSYMTIFDIWGFSHPRLRSFYSQAGRSITPPTPSPFGTSATPSKALSV
jgi:hypothetical protein